MRIVELDCQSHQGAIDAGATNAHHTWTKRRSIVVIVRTDAMSGHGEAAPLPGYSHDDLAITERALEVFARRLPIDLDRSAPLPGELARLLPGVAAPAARCALETALLDAIARSEERPLWRLLRTLFDAEPGTSRQMPVEATPVALAGMIASDNVKRAATAAQTLAARGIRVAKLKIGRAGGFGRELEAAHAVRRAELTLRFDANQSLPPARLEQCLRRLASFDPELVEEPARAPDVGRLAEVPVALGLDETLQTVSGEVWIDRLATTGRLRAVVLKPMALGGPLRCLRLASHARSLGVDAIVSHLFDGPLAWTAAAHLALALPGRRHAAGLDPHPGLAAWPRRMAATIGAMIEDGAIVAPQTPGLGAVAEARG